MTIQLKHLLLVLGGTLLAAGLILGFLPVKADGVSCGTALTGQSDDAQVSDLTRAMIGLRATDTSSQCSDSLSSRRAVSLALGIPGALILLGGVGVAMNQPQPV